MGYTLDKLAADYGLNSHTVYKFNKDEQEFAQYWIENPYSLIWKAFKFSDFPIVDKTL